MVEHAGQNVSEASMSSAWLPARCCGLCPPVRIQSSRRLSLANHGFFMRGAISLGDAYVDDVVVYGSAFIEAHDGEVELARDPRIILCTSAAS